MEMGRLLWTIVLNLALPPQRHSPDTWLEHQEPLIHMYDTFFSVGDGGRGAEVVQENPISNKTLGNTFKAML